MSKYIYSSIKLEGDDFKGYVDSVSGDTIEGVHECSKVNIFVGANNSGKSRFLRSLLKIQDPKFQSKNPNTVYFLRLVNEISIALNSLKEKGNGKGILEFITNKHGSFAEKNFAVVKFDYYDFSANFNDVRDLLRAISEGLQITHISRTRGGGIHSALSLSDDLNKFYREHKSEIDYILSFEIERSEFKRTYVPILRSLNKVDDIQVREREELNDYFKHRTKKVYSIPDEVLVFTGQSIYFDVRDMLLGNHEERRKIAEYEAFLSTELFQGRPVSLIPKVDSDVLNVKIGDDPDRAIYDLGDGIQSLIILTFQMFLIDRGLFFIEEPEINMHPGMQRKFLEVILNKDGVLAKKSHQYFFTTHSNHFLDLTLDFDDISVYKFANSKRGANKTIEQVSSGDERVLQELGVKNSSVFLTNATIWVEGITDRLYIKKFLDLYQKHSADRPVIFEDVDYSFVEYGGSNITHWSFLDRSATHPTICVDRLCAKSMLIADHDGKNKLARHSELKKTLGTRYKKLSCREIENMLSLKTLEKVIKKYPSDAGFVMPILHGKYPHKDIQIGRFIDKKLKPKNNYEGASGSLVSTKKLDFCEKAIEDMEYSEMTSLAMRLAQKIYTFILEQRN